MCGIAGLISTQRISGETLNNLSKVLRHRGPDDEGFYCVPHETSQGTSFSGNDTIDFYKFKDKNINTFGANSGAVCLLHRRLSILDLSPAGHQPMLSDDERFAMVYNGEVYNYLELKVELQILGYHFKSNSDTEVVLKSYEEWGLACFEKFEGMWALAIYDHKKKELLLSRDRFGIKPLYFYKSRSFFAFASELKAFFQIEGISPKANSVAVAEYLSFGSTSEPYKNLYQDIKDLEPGNYMIYHVDSHEFVCHQYYDLASEVKKIELSGGSNAQLFQEALESSISLHLRSDVAIGTCLSGGLDSSAIVSVVAPKMEERKFEVFTAAYKEKEIDESHYAKKVSDNFSNILSHTTYPSAKGFLKDVDQLIYYQDLPIGSTSMYAHWEVMKLVGKMGVKVVLNGQGSDEALGGYESFGGIYLLNLLKKMRFKQYSIGKKLLEDRFKPNIDAAIKRALFYHLPQKIQHYVRGKERIGMGYLNKEFDFSANPPKRGGRNFRSHGLLSFKYGLYDLLRYEDRNSMAFSIESRVPFLDHKVVELALAMKEGEKMFEGWSKYPIRNMINKKLPDEIVWRKGKKGFATPMEQWKKEIFPVITKYISEANLPDLLNKEYILKSTKEELKNPSHLSEFWRMFSFLKWVEAFKVEFD